MQERGILLKITDAQPCLEQRRCHTAQNNMDLTRLGICSPDWSFLKQRRTTLNCSTVDTDAGHLRHFFELLMARTKKVAHIMVARRQKGQDGTGV